MADEITFGFATGKDLKARVYDPDGTRREDPDVQLTEIGSTGLYAGDSASVVAGDLVLVYDNTASLNVGWGEYKPEVSASDIQADLDDIQVDLDEIIVDLGLIIDYMRKNLFVYDETAPPPPAQVIIE